MSATAASIALFDFAGLARAFATRSSTQRWVPSSEGTAASIRVGDRVMVMGPSGLGKSTLLGMLGLLDFPDAGTLEFRDEEMPRRPRSLFDQRVGRSFLGRIRRRHFGFAFQHDHLLEHLSAWENLALPLLVRGCSMTAARARIRPLGQYLFPTRQDGANEPGRGDRAWDGDVEESSPADLSGGMRSRIALGRGLANDPEVLMLDEPFSYFDPRLKQRLASGLKAWQLGGLEALCGDGADNTKQRTILMATHDVESAAWLGTRFIVITEDAKTLVLGKDELGDDPSKRLTELLGATPESDRV
jgi:putative ABC transport system ATP-binding protein